MGSCVAFGCTSRPSKKILGITFHCFPKNEERKQQWVRAVRRKNWAPSSYSTLCSKHFPEEMMDRTSQLKVRLRDNAVPTIFEAYPSYLQQPVAVGNPVGTVTPMNEVDVRNLQPNIASVQGVATGGNAVFDSNSSNDGRMSVPSTDVGESSSDVAPSTFASRAITPVKAKITFTTQAITKSSSQNLMKRKITKLKNATAAQNDGGNLDSHCEDKTNDVTPQGPCKIAAEPGGVERSRKDSSIKQNVNLCNLTMKNTAEQVECDIYGLLVAKKLKQYNAVTRHIVQNQLNNVLMQADVGIYDDPSPYHISSKCKPFSLDKAEGVLRLRSLLRQRQENGG